MPALEAETPDGSADMRDQGKPQEKSIGFGDSRATTKIECIQIGVIVESEMQ